VLFPEVGGLDVGIRPDLGRGSAGDDRPVHHDSQSIRQSENGVHIVFYQQHGMMALDGVQQIDDPFCLSHTHACQWFIEQQNLRFDGQL